MNALSGKTALVTGASRGMGRASALALAKAGAQVLVHYCHEDTAASQVVAQIRAAGGHAEKIAADLCAPDGPHRLASRARVVIGARLDVLVSGASMTQGASMENTSVTDFDDLFALNVRAPYFLVQQLMPAMCQGSSVVLVSPLADPAAERMLFAAACAASHGAVDTLVKYFATTLGIRGVRVNAISPALRHGAQPEDIGGAVVFLASDAARWMTGETLGVDGGSKL